jgi:hypothetical protein
MGAVTFSIDPRLVDALREPLQLSTFVETGTFEGDAVAAVKDRFERVVTVELSQPLWERAAARFRGHRGVEVLLGDSSEVLARIAPTLHTAATLFWLDAHWCVADSTAGEKSQCPLLEELGAIGQLNDRSAVLIDDARLFLAPPPAPHEASHWPRFDEIVHALRRLSPIHRLMVVNDVIAFFPPAAEGALGRFAAAHGVDWLHAMQSLEQNGALRASLEEKEAALQALHASAEAMRIQMEGKEALMVALHRAVDVSVSQHQIIVRALEEKETSLRELRQAVSEHGAGAGELLNERNRGARELATERALAAGELAAERVRAASELAAERARSTAELQAKEAVIQELSRALDAFRRAFPLFRPFLRTALGVKRLLMPRLGMLYQHDPIPLRTRQAEADSPALSQTPTISLVTPSFRQGAFIERTLESVIAQEYPALEYFVQDGGSDDETVEVLQRHAARLSGYDSQPDSGQSQAINRGFARTTGEIMGWLNSDDILLPGALATVAGYFNRHPEVDVVYGHRIVIDENDREIGRWVMPPHDDEVLSWADYVPQETLFWRRRIWDRAGGRIDESFRFAMDWDLLVRFRKAGARFARLPRFIGGFRVHPQQKTSAAISDVGFQEMDRIRLRELGRVPSRAQIGRALAPYLARHVASDIAWRVRRRLAGNKAQ